MSAARYANDARAEARRLRELLERIAALSLGGQQPSQSDLQGALALARITEFHVARAVTALEWDGALPISTNATEATPCL